MKVYDRKTGRLFEEKVYFGWALHFLYSSKFLSRFLRCCIAKNPLISKACGSWQRLPWTRYQVPAFIQKYGLNPAEFEKTEFKSFDDFFTRKLKKEARPIEGDLCMPADGRYLVYPDVEKIKTFMVKGEVFSLAQLLRDEKAANRYKGGSMVIGRLAATDYHRFHFPMCGQAGQARLINGSLYSVHPIAMQQRLDCFTENKRFVTEIQTKKGPFLYLEIGATNVGSIHQTYTVGEAHAQGEEKGYFSFGGSALILLFPKGRVLFDSLLVENTEKKIETRCLMGQNLARLL